MNTKEKVTMAIVAGLALIFLVWAIIMTYYYSSLNTNCNKIPSSIEANKEKSKPIKFGYGPILRNGNFSLVLQTDGNLVIFEKEESDSKILQTTQNQTWTNGELVYDETAHRTTLSFWDTRNTSSRIDWHQTWTDFEKPGKIELTDKGVLVFVGGKDKEEKPIDISKVTGAVPPGGGNGAGANALGSYSRMS